MAFPFDGIVLRDSFVRANEGPPPSSSWSDIDTGLAVVSNECAGTTVGNNIAGWIGSENLFTADHVSAFRLTTKPGAAAAIALYAVQLGAVFNGFVYIYTEVAGGGNDTHDIYRIDAGSLVGPLASAVKEAGSLERFAFVRQKNRHAVWFDDGGGVGTELAAALDWRYDGPVNIWLNMQNTTGRLSGFWANSLPPPPPDTAPGAGPSGGYDPPRMVLL